MDLTRFTEEQLYLILFECEKFEIPFQLTKQLRKGSLKNVQVSFRNCDAMVLLFLNLSPAIQRYVSYIRIHIFHASRV